VTADRVNREDPGKLAQAAARHGARPALISTDFVFDGEVRRSFSADDAPNPVSV
jgi:dTDP-4-dehydrorhamnose reductase